ncbi:BadF/BadG/BcrA/BcrD ATPase family protein [Sedimentimonas flavescens]|uniref:BadF/BadG/BcrA/BcrD ATPase family protein n=1 Tax=Sedimentimonas flavescens TaxID=2851012 RepID=UPI001C4A2C08|nr:BadF/BadG/BcrA/BcrD ATPase family protein [Sedimentimonas flavescens]MBW0158386.1 ATPase [Sedimentimonas flavescens]
MSDSLNNAIIAIDGGGTRCRVALDDGRLTRAIETGSANVSTDFDGAVAQMIEGMNLLARKVDLPVQALWSLPAFVGLAGVTGAEMRARLCAALPFTAVRVEDDRPAALRGALGDRDGVVAHCGTGSFFAAQIRGVMRLAGGWGPVLGDRASAQWVGREALRATLDCVDDLQECTPLANRLLSEMGGSPGIVRFASRARPVDFGALAPLVTDYAGKGDALALGVMATGASEIAALIPQMGWVPGQAICLTGGIGPHFMQFLPAAMLADVAAPQGSPLDGALTLAREFAKEIAHERS